MEPCIKTPSNISVGLRGLYAILTERVQAAWLLDSQVAVQLRGLMIEIPVGHQCWQGLLPILQALMLQQQNHASALERRHVCNITVDQFQPVSEIF